MKSKNSIAAAAGGVFGWALVKTLGVKRYSFKNKTVLIPGGTRGLGLAIARELAGEGANLVLVGRSESETESVRDELALRRAPMLVRLCDWENKSEIAKVVDDARGRFGRIEVLINCIEWLRAESATVDSDEFDSMFRENFWSPIQFVQETIPDLSRYRGRIVNIVSLSGKIPMPHYLAYHAGKSALAAYSEGLTLDLARRGVCVTTVFPGLVTTDTSPASGWLASLSKVPGIALGSEDAASRIIAACRDGRRELHLTALSSVVSRFHGLAPEISLAALDFLRRWLPEDTDAPDKIVTPTEKHISYRLC